MDLNEAMGGHPGPGWADPVLHGPSGGRRMQTEVTHMDSPQPVAAADRTKNPLRPQLLSEMIGQDRAKRLVQRAIHSAQERVIPLPHALFVGASGTGKSTFSHVIGNELGVDVYEVQAPVSHDTLLELRECMYPGDILRVEEIHLQAIQERRGKSSATQPEVLFSVMEDRTIATRVGVLEFPAICVIGTTTDEGLLPDAFVNRFPLRPPLSAYSRDELLTIAVWNAEVKGATIDDEAAGMIADACRGVPREINNLVENARMFSARFTAAVIDDVLEANEITRDGLTRDMQAMVRFLYTRAKRVNKTTGDVTYQASVNTIATAIGKSRDSKAVALRVEPYLIEKGYVQVGHGGRLLTDAGVERAKELCQ